MRVRVVGMEDREAAGSWIMQGFVTHSKEFGFLQRALGIHKCSERFLVGN